jgi:hypothetical protein
MIDVSNHGSSSVVMNFCVEIGDGVSVAILEGVMANAYLLGFWLRSSKSSEDRDGVLLAGGVPDQMEEAVGAGHDLAGLSDHDVAGIGGVEDGVEVRHVTFHVGLRLHGNVSLNLNASGKSNINP